MDADVCCPENGHLRCGKWLYENGVKEDVSKANNEGLTPMHIASKNGAYLRVCEWLILNGILTDERLLNDDKHKNIKKCPFRMGNRSDCN